MGAGVSLVGLALDVYAHVFTSHNDAMAFGSYTLSEHLAHLVVLIGMLTALGSVIATGMRAARGAADPRTGGTDAIR